MPLFEQERSRRGRLKVMARTQLPLLIATAFMASTTALLVPNLRADPLLVAGSLIILGSSLAGALLPWERWRRGPLLVLAIADIVGVAMVESALLPYLPAVGLLVIFPVLWLAFGFSRRIIFVAVLGALFVSVFPFLTVGRLPHTSLEWLSIVTLPLLVTGVAVLVSLAAEQLRSRRRQLTRAFDAQQAALDKARDADRIARGILQTVNAGVAFFDAEGRLDLANERAVRYADAVGFRLDRPPYSGERMYLSDRASTIPVAEQPIPRGLSGETVEQHFAWIGPVVQRSAVITSTNAVRRDTGELLGTVIVMYDVTELAEAVDIREQFLRTVSHELRTPLATAVGYLDLLTEAPDLPPVLARRLETACHAMERLTTRIAELLAASHDHVELSPARVNVGQLIEDCIESLDLPARGRVLRFGTGGADLEAEADPQRLSQAIRELLTNAIKFGGEEMPVLLRVSADAGQLEIQITDTGPGMSRTERARAFDSFYRAPAVRSEAIQGFGLGLHIVRNVVLAHGGDIELRSAVGVGTTAVVTIPRLVR